ncbi:hypothetical protein BDU57DRAFT_511476 [Ampelomyces quisqualis]|uniref:Uncharacterized protein n=1 Tax=Ampelomyces quisqualis TaxID=50730 RepID=A0A6A5QV26_AMPQU|nr:hypothetical protein BDU57DRAFT_511476 [Ampelomyces quisqualis]
MANNDDDPRRNRDPFEDNPFIAFRRFADSQVSSLLNTVFTLPATIANSNNAHQAREACLFKKADKTQCEKLQQLENEIAGLRQEGRALYRVGDFEEVLEKGEELVKLKHHADELRKEIVGQSDEGRETEDTKELVQRVANRKGQEWGWDWSWGFPKPFDDDNQSSDSDAYAHGVADRNHEKNIREAVDRHQQQQTAALRHFKAEAKEMFGGESWDDAVRTVTDMLGSSPMLRRLMGERAWEEMLRLVNEVEGHDSSNERWEIAEQQRALREAAMRSERWAYDPYSPEALASNNQMRQPGVNWREAYEDLVRTQKGGTSAGPCVPWADEGSNDEPSYEYSHDHEDQHDDPPTPKAKPSQAWCHPAQSQGISEKREFLREQQQNGRQLGLQRDQATCEDWCVPAQGQTASDKAHLQKYLQEQQEQHSRYLGLRDASNPAETELDVYEQLLEQPKTTMPVLTARNGQSSILSTLTTTERSVAPDGSVTTKVVLKKHFADGREENTETIHTQRRHEMHPWQSSRTTSAPPNEKSLEEQDKGKKKSGWFWSN